MPAFVRHHFCTPLLVRKDTTIPPSEIEPPIYVVTWGNMANIYTDKDRAHVIDVVMKGGRSQRHEHMAEAFQHFEEFCYAHHPDDIHTCISSRYRVPIHAILERFPAIPPGIPMDVKDMMFIDDGTHAAVDDPSEELPTDIPVDSENSLAEIDRLYPPRNGVYPAPNEESNVSTSLPSRSTSPASPVARENTPEPTASPTTSPTTPSVASNVPTKTLKPIWYLIRLRSNCAFLHANRTPALALFNFFLNRGCMGEYTFGTIPDGNVNLLKKKPAAGEVVYFGVRGFYRFGVFLDFQFALEILSQGVGIHHAPASMIITTDKRKAKRWSRADFEKDFDGVIREEMGLFSGEA